MLKKTLSRWVLGYGYFAALNPAESHLGGATKPHQKDTEKRCRSKKALDGFGDL